MGEERGTLLALSASTLSRLNPMFLCVGDRGSLVQGCSQVLAELVLNSGWEWGAGAHGGPPVQGI